MGKSHEWQEDVLSEMLVTSLDWLPLVNSDLRQMLSWMKAPIPHPWILSRCVKAAATLPGYLWERGPLALDSLFHILHPFGCIGYTNLCLALLGDNAVFGCDVCYMPTALMSEKVVTKLRSSTYAQIRILLMWNLNVGRLADGP